ncbi:uncharacterized protein isoform X1 [Danio rerio]|uniref:Uncharacterized protein isoform X1 n=1 Tax=Danio rerio TaxID=7955 RepID=A0AB32TRG7_DANRE
MDYSAQFRREATGELTLKPSPEAVALAAAYRKNPTPGRSWPAARVKEEAIARVAAAGGDSSCHQLVLSESALQFGQYRGKTFKWLLSNDVGYAAMVLAVHQREREAGDTTQSFIMGNKDALLRYAGLFPVMMAAISERRVREGHGTPAQEDQVLVGFGNFAAMSFKDLYEATDRDRKGFVKWVKRQSSRPGTKMELFQKYIRRRDAEMLPGSAPPVAASSSAPEEEPSDEALLAVVSHMDVSGGNYVGLNLPFNLRILCYFTFICPTGLLYVI